MSSLYAGMQNNSDAYQTTSDSLITHHSLLIFTLWGDEIFGRHTLLSRGWGTQDKLSVEPTLLLVRPTRVDHYSLHSC
jgi:hypothetical protein